MSHKEEVRHQFPQCISPNSHSHLTAIFTSSIFESSLLVVSNGGHGKNNFIKKCIMLIIIKCSALFKKIFKLGYIH